MWGFLVAELLFLQISVSGLITISEKQCRTLQSPLGGNTSDVPQGSLLILLQVILGSNQDKSVETVLTFKEDKMLRGIAGQTQKINPN